MMKLEIHFFALNRNTTLVWMGTIWNSVILCAFILTDKKKPNKCVFGNNIWLYIAASLGKPHMKDI